MPSHTPEEQIKALINPLTGPPDPLAINPLLGSQAPPPQQQLGPVAQPQAPTGGGGIFASLFGGGQGQNLSTKSRRQLGRDALFSAGISLLEQTPDAQGFSPTSLQGLGRSLRAGRETFAENAAIEQESARQDAAEDLLNSAGDSPAEQIAALKRVRNSFLASGQDKLADTVEDMIQNLSPDEDFTTKSLGDGLFVTTNNNTGATRIGGKFNGDNSVDSTVPGSKNNPWVRAQGINPATGIKEWMQYPKLNPLDITWQGLRVNEADTGGPRRFSEIGVKAAIGAEQAGSALDGFFDFFDTGLAQLDQPFTDESLGASTTVLQPLQNTLMASKNRIISAIGRSVSGLRAEVFRKAQEQGKEAIGRISSGAAINESEVARFESMLPQTAEEPEITFQKLIFLRDLRTLLQTIADSGVIDKKQIAETLRNSGILERADPTIDQVEARGVLGF